MKNWKHSGWIAVLGIIVLAMIIGWSTCESWAAEEKYPNRPIQVVFAVAPGSTDVAIRIFTDKMAEFLGQPMVFVYKPGGGGAIGSSFVVKAKPDGYTLIGTSQSPVVLNPLIREELNYTSADFAPICRLARSSIVLAVNASSPYKSAKDIVEEAKKSPGKLIYSTAGVLGNMHIATQMFAKAAGIKMVPVHCAGTSPALTALLGNHVSLTTAAIAPVSPHIKSGALRPIAFLEKERLKEFPNVPTLSELGYPVVYSIWYGLFTPKGTPEEVVKTIYAASRKAVEGRRNLIEDQLGKISLGLDFLNPQELAREIKVEEDTMKPILKELKAMSNK